MASVGLLDEQQESLISRKSKKESLISRKSKKESLILS